MTSVENLTRESFWTRFQTVWRFLFFWTLFIGIGAVAAPIRSFSVQAAGKLK